MPAPERTTTAAIVASGRAIVEQGGTAALTMQAVADRVGVRAPSLYKRIAGRDALLAAVVAATLADLAADVAGAAEGADGPRARIVDIATATRAFAHRSPVGYSLVFGGPSATSPDAAALATAARPLLDATRELVGDDDALDAARLLTAWLHGFLAMDLSGAFQLGGDVDDAFAYGLERILAAIER